MVTMTFIYDCVYVTGTRTHFSHWFRCLPAPVPTFDQAHSTSTILLCHLDGNLSAVLSSCSTARTRSSAAPLYVLPVVYTLRSSTTQCDVLLFFCQICRNL